MSLAHFRFASLILVAPFLAIAGGRAQGVRGAARDGVVVPEAQVRRLLPADGALIEKGDDAGGRIALALGREVRAGSRTGAYVTDRPIGERGFALRDGHIELNIGAHVEKKEQKGLRDRSLAVDLGARVLLKLDEELNVRVEIEWLYIRADGLKGKLVVALARRRFEEAVEAQARAFADRLNDQVGRKLPEGPRRVSVQIEPGRIVVAPRVR